jgi:hypothetical protein
MAMTVSMLESRVDDEDENTFLQKIATQLGSVPAKSLLLEATAPRNQLNNELIELQSFLKQRLVELRSHKDVGLNLNVDLAEDTQNNVQLLLTEVKAILDPIMSPRTQQLLLLRSSTKLVFFFFFLKKKFCQLWGCFPSSSSIIAFIFSCSDTFVWFVMDSRYADRLALSITQKLELSRRMEEADQQTEIKTLEIESSLSQMAPRLTGLIAATKAFKQLAELELSKVFGGRVVNITGAINQL